MTTAGNRIGERERREITAILVWSAVALFLLYIAFAQILRKERRLNAEVQTAEQLLATYETRVEGKTLSERILSERQKKQYLLNEWKRYSNLLETWKTRNADEPPGDPAEAARIDFKVAFFNARERLNQKAQEAGTILPVDLGISESIGTDENTAVRFLQLAAVQRLVGFALDLKLPEILEIRAMQPEPTPAADGGPEYLDQYPVRLRLRCSLNSFAQFLAQVMRAQHFFTTANVFAEKTARKDPDLVDVTVMFNALVLKEENP
jgi:hypothetical protein